MRCAYHPGAETVLRCSKCEKPICPRCVVQTPVGGRCKECARVQRLPQFQVSAVYLLRGMGAALAVGLAVGIALGFADGMGLIPWRLRWILLPAGLAAAGYLVGRAVSAATNRKQGTVLQLVALGGFVACAITLTLLAPAPFFGWYTLVGAIVGVALAVQPFR